MTMDFTLKCQNRDFTLKSKQLRKQGWIPGSVYGKHHEPVSIQIPWQPLTKCLKAGHKQVTLDVDGKSFTVSFDNVQYDHLGSQIFDVAFHSFKANEEVTMTIPVTYVNQESCPGIKTGGVLATQLNEVTVFGYPKDIPNEFTVDLAELELGSSIHLEDVAKNWPFEIKDDHTKVIVAVNYPKLEALPEDEPTETVVDETTTPVEGETVTEEVSEEKKAA
jgi:large subunit ribosomal protein L25